MPIPGRAVTLSLSLLAVAAVGYGLYERYQRASLAEAHAALKAELVALEERATRAEERARELQAELDRERERLSAHASLNDTTPAPADSAPEGNAASASGMPPAFGGRSGALFALMEDPAFVKLWTAQQRAQLDARYGDLFKRLNLSPADLERFKDLLVEKQSAFREVISAARAQGLNPRENRPELRRLAEQTAAEVDANIQAMLGSDGFAKYQYYEQTAAQRSLVGQLDRRLSYSGAALTDTQADDLVRILAETNKAQNPTQNPVRNRPGSGRTTITNQAVAQAAGVLNASQLQVLQQLQSEQQAQTQLNQMLRDARNQPRAPQPTTPTPRPPGG